MSCPDTKNLKFKLCHINFLASDPENAVVIPESAAYDIGVINRYISDMKKLGWVCTLNHPGWSLQTSEEINAPAEDMDVWKPMHLQQHLLIRRKRKQKKILIVK